MPLRAWAQVAVVGALVLLATAATPVAANTAGPAAQPSPTAATDSGVEVTLFHLDSCPHCHAARAFLAELQTRYPALSVDAYEVSDPAARRQFEAASERHGFEPAGVPTILLDDQVWIGFDATTADALEEAVAAAAEPSPGARVNTPDAPVDSPDPGPSPPTESAGAADDAVVDVPVLGTVDLGARSLVTATAVIGFLDGFNPCSLWVLSLLLALVLHTGSRRRVVAVGSVFLVVTTALYGVYIAGFFTVLGYASSLGPIRVGVAVLAGVFGLLNIKDFFAFRRGPSLTISDRHKPRLLQRMRAVSRRDRPLPAVLAATAALAVGVSLLETPCTAGFPLLWSNLLAERGVGLTAGSALFALYMVVFLLDELAVFGAAVVTMRAAKLQERHGRALKLVGGVVMLALAGVMLAAPDVLDSVAGMVAVFAGAAVVTGAVLAVQRRRATTSNSGSSSATPSPP